MLQVVTSLLEATISVTKYAWQMSTFGWCVAFATSFSFAIYISNSKRWRTSFGLLRNIQNLLDQILQGQRDGRKPVTAHECLSSLERELQERDRKLEHLQRHNEELQVQNMEQRRQIEEQRRHISELLINDFMRKGETIRKRDEASQAGSSNLGEQTRPADEIKEEETSIPDALAPRSDSSWDQVLSDTESSFVSARQPESRSKPSVAPNGLSESGGSVSSVKPKKKLSKEERARQRAQDAAKAKQWREKRKLKKRQA